MNPYLHRPDHALDLPAITAWNAGVGTGGLVSALAGVNGGPGDNSFPPNGADDAPNKPKGRHSALPAPASLTPPCTNGCWDCGRLWSMPGWVDAWIPDELWTRIAPLPEGRGYLCVHCITAALDRIGAQDVPVELWANPYRRGGYIDPVFMEDAVVAGLVGSLATRGATP